MTLDDKTRIKILKSTNILTIGALAITQIGGHYVLKAYERRQKQLKLAERLLMRFVELAPEEVSAQIMSEFEFEYVTKDLLDMPDFPKGK